MWSYRVKSDQIDTQTLGETQRHIYTYIQTDRHKDTQKDWKMHRLSNRQRQIHTYIKSNHQIRLNKIIK